VAVSVPNPDTIKRPAVWPGRWYCAPVADTIGAHIKLLGDSKRGRTATCSAQGTPAQLMGEGDNKRPPPGEGEGEG